MFYQDAYGLLRILVLAPLAYIGLIVALRLAGKRSLAKLNAFDFVITIALGSAFAAIIVDKQVPLAEGALVLLMLLGLQWLLTRWSVHSRAFAGLIRARPRLLFRDGAFLAQALQDARITRGELTSAIRLHGFGRFDQVAAVILEGDGSLSVIGKQDEGPLDTLDEVVGFDGRSRKGL